MPVVKLLSLSLRSSPLLPASRFGGDTPHFPRAGGLPIPAYSAVRAEKGRPRGRRRQRGFLLPALHAVLRASLPGSLWLQPPASLGPSRSNLITPPHDLAAATGRHPRLLSSDGPDLFLRSPGLRGSTCSLKVFSLSNLRFLSCLSASDTHATTSPF